MCRSSLEKGVSRKVSAILSAIPSPTTRAPMHRTFASLCSRVASALKQSPQSAARMPGILFAVMETPIPVPQMMMPRSHSPETTAFATPFAYTGQSQEASE